jgi:hypothetical protein
VSAGWGRPSSRGLVGWLHAPHVHLKVLLLVGAVAAQTWSYTCELGVMWGWLGGTHVVKVVTGRLCGAGKQRAAHDGGRAQCQRLDDVARVLDATVRDDGHTW